MVRLAWHDLRRPSCDDAKACSCRAAVVLSASPQRATHTLSVLRQAAAFEAVAQLTPQAPQATFNSKIASNWLAFMEGMEAVPAAWTASPNASCERWLYLFEDDVDVHPLLAGSGQRAAVARALRAAEERAAALGRPVVYGGLCGARCANRTKVNNLARSNTRPSRPAPRPGQASGAARTASAALRAALGAAGRC